ncbi:DEAD/DEAH box helicase [Alloalcanivorax gelatiniphagus]
MDIRHSLTDAYLAGFFDAGALARARAYVAAVEELEVVHETASSLTATATVRGTSAGPYDVQLHAEVDDAGDWVFSSCSCPVGRMCKHGAAVALRVREPVREQRPTEAGWRRHLGRLGDDLEARARSTMTGEPLGLEVVRRPAGRWSRSSAGELSMRPVRPGARRGWVRSGAEWTDLAGPVAGSRFVPAQAESLQVLRRGLVARHTYLVAGAAPMLDDYDDRLVPAVRAAIAAGVTLVPGAGLASVAVSSEPAEVVADVTEADGTLTLRTWVRVGERRVRGGHVAPIGRPTTSVALFDGDDVVLADLSEPCHDAVVDLVLDDPVSIEADDREAFLDALALLRRLARVESTDGSVQLPAPPRPRLLLTVTWRASTHADLDWRWAYGDRTTPLSGADPLGGLRDAALEQALLATVPAGLVSTGTMGGGDALAFALHDLPHLRTLDGVDVVEHAPPDFREATDDPAITFTLADAPPGHTDWLDLEVHVSVDGEQVPLPDVLAAVTRGDEFLVLPSGTYVELARPELARLHEVVALAAQLRESDPDRLRVGASDLGVWAELADIGVVDEQVATWVERATALRDVDELPRPEPLGLTTTLRPYQLEGFWWLAFLHQHGLGGVLADDMGLGKTLQVLALFQHAVARGSAAPFLVVAPTSVVTAWTQQAAAHAPGLRVGVVRRRSDDVATIAASHDVVVTTYALLRLEREQFAALRWDGLVLDEAQQVKNHQGKTYAAARAIDAGFRLAVTGTPFENRLMELWSLLSITAPGLYPTSRRFREVVVGPVEKDGDDAALRRFRTRIRPFVLRRTKDLVAADLPPKQEQVLDVELAPRHRRIYDTHLAKERQRILGLVEDGFDRNRVAIFTALTRLRQLALDPALVDPAHDRVGSAKTELLTEHLLEITAEGHRSLVFSTFTTFLRRVRDRLTEAGVPTVYLDGTTRDRDAVIDAFRDGAAPVFLISLKAGGTGLTLTEADYVFLLDPWWNPAAEAQAVDRAHRIGQSRHVHVYRLVATDTIEEKVMALKARKAALFAKVVDGGGASATGITAEDIRAIFDA